MRPAARVQAAIELLDEIIIAARDNGSAADQLASSFFKARRYAGSKDRRAIRNLVWDVIRKFGERPETGRSAVIAMADHDPELAACFDGSQYGPRAIDENEARAGGEVIPQWIEEYLPPIFDDPAEKQALLNRAPLDLRVNQSRSERDLLLAEFDGAQALGDHAIRLPTGTNIAQSKPYVRGLAEIQDYGSQLITDACGDVTDKKILDLCAGAGGKTLSLLDKAIRSGSLIDIVATDVNRSRLSKITDRQARLMDVDRFDSSLDVVRRILLNPGQEMEKLGDFEESFDIVLVDAPCSGSGTWRRNPETRWRLNPERLEQVKRQQSRVLDIAEKMVKKGGILVYAVCSILDQEGRLQIERFQERTDGWKVQNIRLENGRDIGDGKLLTPHHDHSDGFFFARLEKM